MLSSIKNRKRGSWKVCSAASVGKTNHGRFLIGSAGQRPHWLPRLRAASAKFLFRKSENARTPTRTLRIPRHVALRHVRSSRGQARAAPRVRAIPRRVAAPGLHDAPVLRLRSLCGERREPRNAEKESALCPAEPRSDPPGLGHRPAVRKDGGLCREKTQAGRGPAPPTHAFMKGRREVSPRTATQHVGSCLSQHRSAA